MPHRISVAALPSFGDPETLSPRAAAQPGVRVSGVGQRSGALVFRAEGPELAPGLYEEQANGDEPATPLALDPPGYRLLNPVVAGDHTLALLSSSGRVPAHTTAIALIDADGECASITGEAFGLSDDGTVAVVIDLGAKLIRRVDLASREVTEVGGLDAGIDPQLAPRVGVNRDGSVALVMDARNERGDASLERFDLHSGDHRRLIGPLPPPSWVLGAFGPDDVSVVALEVRAGDNPLSRLLALGPKGGQREILTLPVSQPAVMPVFIDDHTLITALTLEPYPAATYGPVDLVAVAVGGGSQIPILRLDGECERIRYRADAIWVEGGPRLIRLPLKRG